LGEYLYQMELEREKMLKPDLKEFRFEYWKLRGKGYWLFRVCNFLTYLQSKFTLILN
jgi:hypothetical protein